MIQEEGFWRGKIMQWSDSGSDGRWDVTQLFLPFIKWLISETPVCRSVCPSVVRWRRNSERPSPSPSCWLPWKRLASQPASRRRYGMFWLVFTIWELPEPVEVTLIHHRHSHSVSKPSRPAHRIYSHWYNQYKKYDMTVMQRDIQYCTSWYFCRLYCGPLYRLWCHKSMSYKEDLL